MNELISRPPKHINLGLAALHLAKERFPGLDVAAEDRKLDFLASRMGRLAVELQGRVERPETTAMNRVLFDQEEFRYDVENLKRNSPDPGFLSYLLDTGQGDCLSMTAACLAAAQRLDWPIYPVSAPGHIFLRYVGTDGQTYNIEPTAGGDSFPDELYTQNLAVSARGYEKGAYLRILSDREFLARLLNHSAAGLSPEKAIPRLEKAVELDPTCAPCYMHLSGAHHMKSIMTEGEESLRHDEEAKRCAEKADALGWVALEDTPLWKQRMGQ